MIGLTSAFGAAGVPFAATPFIASWNPSAQAKAVGAPVKVDVTKIDPGQQNSNLSTNKENIIW